MRRDPVGITPEQRQQIIDEVSSGEFNIATAATKYNIPRMIINRWLNVVPTPSSDTDNSASNIETRDRIIQRRHLRPFRNHHFPLPTLKTD